MGGKRRSDDLDERFRDLRHQRARSSIERVTMFVDLVGSTDLKSELYADALNHIYDHNQIVEGVVAELAEKHRDESGPAGEVVKLIGDEVMATFCPKRSHVAVEAAIEVFRRLRALAEEMNTRPLASKVGISLGKVYPLQRGDGPADPLGLPVDIAARLVSIAKPFQVLVDDGFRRRTPLEDPHGPRYADAQQIKLKGVHLPQAVSELLEPNADLRGIDNLPQLRPEAKRLEESVTNLMLMRRKMYDLLVEPLKRPEIEMDVIKKVEENYDDLVKKGRGELELIYQQVRDAHELSRHPDLLARVDRLRRTFEHARGLLTSGYAKLLDAEESDQRTVVREHEVAFAAIFDAAKDLQVYADQLVRLADGTLNRIELVEVG